MTTGVGAVINTAKVEPGANVVVFGLGGIAMSCVYGLPFGAAYAALAVLHLVTSVVAGTL